MYIQRVFSYCCSPCFSVEVGLNNRDVHFSESGFVVSVRREGLFVNDH